MIKRLLAETGSLRLYLLTVVGIGVLAGALAVGQCYALSQAVDAVFLRGAALDGLAGWLLALLAVILLRALLAWANEVAAAGASSRAKRNLREPLARKLMSLGPAYTRGERSGELSNLVLEGVESLDAYFGQYLPQVFLTALVPLIVVIAVFSADALSGVVLLVTAPVLPIFMVLIGRMADALTHRQWRRMSFMSAHFLDVLQGLTTLRLFNRSLVQRETIARITRQYGQATLGVLRVAFLSALVLEVAATISTAIIAVEVGLRLLYGGMTFQPALFVLLLAPEFYMPFRALGARFHASMGGTAAAKRIFEVLDIEEEKRSVQPARQLAQNAPIRFEDVSYTYDSGESEERPALHEVSFDIIPGQTVALVGPSGAGKSTVAQLLLRFAEPSSGGIMVGDAPLSGIDAREWRSMLAWVPQQPYLFHSSVADNIRLGDPTASMDAVIRAAQAAHAHDFVQSLPEGYDTVIGERGARLSGGQAQRIGLARAFLKDAPILILDEATSNLDPEHEALIVEATERLMQGRTVLVIAHRLATVYRAGQVIVLDRGRVVQMGDHASLLREGGLYERLVSTQGERVG